MLLVLTLLPCPLYAQWESQGEIVQSVEIETDSAYDVSTVTPLVQTSPGEPLTIRGLQQTIRNLFASGDFRDVRIDAEPVPGGVALRILLSLHYRVDQIQVEGAEDELERARREIRIREADVLRLAAVDRSAVEIQRMLSGRGYLESTVDPEVRFFRQENRANITFHVDLGPLARIAEVVFEGDPGPYATEELLRRMESKPGEIYRIPEARRDADRVRNFLVNEGRRRADVRFLGGEESYDPETDSAVLRYRVNAGPVVRVEVEGVSRRSVRRLIPFDRGQPYSEDVVDRAADRIIEHYQRRGHFTVAVDVKEEEAGDEFLITYRVEPGPKYRLDEVRFSGNDQIQDRRLREVIATGPSGGFRRVLRQLLRRPAGVTQDQLNADRDDLEAFYRLEGFTQVRVGRAEVETQAGGTLEVTFPITEGPQTIVASLAVEGNEQIRSERLPSLELKEGEPLNPQKLTQDVVRLKTFYGDRGFVEIQVVPVLDFSDDRTRVQIAYQITEGPRVTIDEVVVRGNSYTESDLVLRKAELEKGEPFSYRQLLEAQRNLYRLGIFQRVDLLPQQAGTSLSTRDIVIQVEEGNALTVSGSLGYSTEEGARGSASVSHRNLFGTGRYLGLEGTISQRVERFVLSYREPFLFRLNIPTQLTVFQREELRADEKAKIESLGTFVEATRVIPRDVRLSLRYDYRIVECVVQQTGDLCDLATGTLPIEGIPREDQEIEISSITPGAFWDRRDDAINPSRGFYSGASLEYAFPLFRADAHFFKGFTQGGWIRPLSERSQFVVAARLGGIEPLQEQIDGTTVPFAERFLLGGETTHRAFELDQLGIPCQTLVPDPEQIPEGVSCTEFVESADQSIDFIAVGGNAMGIINLEYRFPIFGESVRGAVFVDAGNVWRQIGEVDLSDLRYGVGAGVRYLTPIGPLRFDIGWKLDRKPYEDPYVTFLTLGYGF